MESSAAGLWDTTLLYPSADAPEVQADLEGIRERVDTFRVRYRGAVSALEPVQFFAALEEYGEIQELATRPSNYAYLLFSQDSTLDSRKSFFQKMSEFANLLARDLMFFELEIMEMEEGPFERVAQDDSLAGYRHFLQNVRRFRSFALPEREEQLLKQKDLTGVEAFTSLFDEISASYSYTMELEGEEREMAGEELLGLLHHPDGGVRERAFSLFLERHGRDHLIYTSVLNTIMLDHAQSMDLRGYLHPMQPTNLSNDIPDRVVETLMEVSRANYPLARRYYRMKASLLGLPRLKNSDMYAPLPGRERTYGFPEAHDTVLEALGRFSGSFREIAEAFFTERRVDLFPRTGKSGGAYCMGMTPRIPPFVLLNFSGTPREVATIAHELGHGIHFVLAQRQNMLNYHPPLPLAESASTFCELLLSGLLRERAEEPAVRRDILCGLIEDIIATTMRQNVLTSFEERIHRHRREGHLSTARLSEIWLEENALLYGDEVEMIEPYRWGWTYISHFVHSRFYCYSYIFGELLVLSLYRRYLEEGEAFVPLFREILASGGSRSPAETLALAGIDPLDPSFWQKGYDYLAELLDELEGITP